MSAYDPSNPKHVAIARRTAKAVADSKATFLKHAMGLVDGRTFIHNLLNGCNVFSPTLFSENDSRTAYNCGRHSVGQDLLEDVMHVAPDDYTKMMREAYARDIADDTRRSRSDADSGQDDSGPEPYTHPAFDRAPVIGPVSEGDGGDYSPIEREAEDGGEV